MQKERPGFFLQLRLLLWKNFTIKRRSPVVFLVEALLPLVLILILLLIRKSQFAYQIPTSRYTSKPLPSAGIIPILQLFCDGPGDVYEKENERLETFLNQFQTVVKGLDRLHSIYPIQNTDDIWSTGREQIPFFKADDPQEVNISSMVEDEVQFAKILKKYGIEDDISTSFLLSAINMSQIRQSMLPYFDSKGHTVDSAGFIAEILYISLLSNSPVLDVTNMLQSREILKTSCEQKLISQLVIPGNMMETAAIGQLEEKLCEMDADSLVQLATDLSSTVDTETFLSQIGMQQEETGRESSFEDIANMKQLVNNLMKSVEDLPWKEMGLPTCPVHKSANLKQNSTSTNHVHKPLKDKYGGLIQFWKLLEPTLCGIKEPKVTPHDVKQNNSDPDHHTAEDIQLTSQQKKYFSVVKNILYRNPKILYAPNNTVVQKIIKKANESFMLYDSISLYARQWLNISEELRKDPLLPSVLKQPPNLTNTSFHHKVSLNATLDIMDSLACAWLGLVENMNFDIFKGFRTEMELEDYFLKRQYHDNVTVIAGLVFENIDDKITDLPAHVRYKIRQNATLSPPTNVARNPVWSPTPGSNNLMYYDFGFVWIQDMIERTIVDLQVGRDVSEPGNYIRRIPYPCWPWDGFVWNIKHIFPLCLMLSWVYMVSTLVQRIVYEKEKRLKEVMKMMGMSSTVHWCAWFITAVGQVTILVLAMTLMLHYGRVLPYSDPSLLFVFMEVFAISSISFSFLISSFYSKSRLAAACAGIFYFLTYVPYIYISIREVLTHQVIPASAKIAASLFSTTAFGLGGKYFLFYEIEGVGVTWENMATSPRENDDFSLLMILYMMVIDTVLYAVLTWYIENIHPGTYGLPKPWYFPLTKSYWCGPESKTSVFGLKRLFGMKETTKYTRVNQIDDDPLILNAGTDDRFEEETSGNPVGVEICHLTKVYNKGSRPAVDDLNLTLYENQITAFLGHNGAGKTTTMSILTGLFPPTSGTAYVYGRDISTDMEIVRESLGMCPQHNVLFESLTVEEHLWFYARLKGMQADSIKEESERMLGDLGLLSKRSTLPSCLSGGMQRKLSVAIAFVGGSKTIILDEPTAGVDPFSRRSIWKLLGQYKKGRTILLSTHHMDEADELGDRIAVISNGHLKCCGSSLYLKALLGDGQHLHILKKSPDDAIVNTLEDNSKTQDILENIHTIVPGSFVKFESREELVVTVPVGPTEKHKLAEICEILYSLRESLCIKSFGVTDSGLEEIFVKITEESALDEKSESGKGYKIKGRSSKMKPDMEDLHLDAINNTAKDDDDGGDDNDDDTFISMIPESGTQTSSDNIFRTIDTQKGRNPFKHFKALFIKRIQYTLRNRKGVFSQIFLPAVFVSISMTIALSAPKESDPPEMTMSTGQFFRISQPRGNFVPFFIQDSNTSVIRKDADGNHLMETIKYYPSGLGGDCTLRGSGIKLYKNVIQTLRKKRQSKLQLEEDFYSEECQNVFSRRIDIRSNLSRKIPDDEIRKDVTYYPTCQCKKYSRFVCSTDPITDPPEFSVVTGDHLQNISGLDEEEFYLYTTDLYKLHRYGGFSLGQHITYVPDDYGDSTSFKGILGRLVVPTMAKVRFNQNGFHSMPTYVNSLNNAILRANLPKSRGNPAAYGITVINHPMKKTGTLLDTDYIKSGTDVLMAIFIIIAMSFVPASFVVFLVHERAIKAKHLQFISGVRPITYWLSNLIWDMFNYIIPATCIMGILLAFRIPAYVGKGNIEAVSALFLVYGWSITPMMYPATFLFKESSVAYISLIIMNLFTGITCVVTCFMLQIFDSDSSLSSVNHVLKKIFLVFPNFCLGDGLMDIALNQYENDFYFHIGQYDKIKSPMVWHITGRKLVAMAATGLVFFIFTLFCEYGFFIKQRKQSAMLSTHEEDIDFDVLREKEKVSRGAAANDLLRLINLTKVYKTRKRGNITAVNGLNLAVTKGECFGLLGVNGAGKTTTFKILTGDIQPSSGDTTLLNYSVLKDKHLVQQNIGYCPQFDALFDELTPREHLQLYARLQGIPSQHETRVVSWALEKLGLEKYSSQTSGTLSGGNKRKLSTAISLVGNPPLLYMDEPTAGMDPYSKKYLWKTIHDLVKDGKSVVFTSHSMEECEILCSRLSIMVNGQLKCLGSIQHLKDKFGEGYTLKMTLKSRDQFRKILSELKETVGRCRLKERGPKLLIFEIESDWSKLAGVYRCLEELVAQNSIVEYSLSQNTLDNVFISFARQQSQSSSEDVTVQEQEPEMRIEEPSISDPSAVYDEPLIELSPRGCLSQDMSDEELIPL